MSALPVPSRLTPEDARALTEEVKGDAVGLGRKLLRCYDEEAHIALGYSSWATYCEDEFGWSDATAYRLLQSARVVRQLPMGSPLPATERVARELVPLRDEPETMREAWSNAIERHGPAPTAAQVREVVTLVLRVPSLKAAARMMREDGLTRQCRRGSYPTKGVCARLLVFLTYYRRAETELGAGMEAAA